VQQNEYVPDSLSSGPFCGYLEDEVSTYSEYIKYSAAVRRVLNTVSGVTFHILLTA
jgi:hypothetical protein